MYTTSSTDDSPPQPDFYIPPRRHLCYLTEKVEVPGPPPLPKHQPQLNRAHTISTYSTPSSPESSTSDSSANEAKLLPLPASRPSIAVSPPPREPSPPKPSLRKTLAAKLRVSSDQKRPNSWHQGTADVPSRRTSRYYQDDPEIQAKLERLARDDRIVSLQRQLSHR
ncbi:hypothetical protein BC940DRAFT_298470 [Gongronella butleri]|nr:hypothetical protein BC940DRAFT_298470 [Gongronella butleri]